MSCDTDFIKTGITGDECIDTDLLSKGMFNDISGNSVQEIINGFADLTRVIEGENVKSVYTNELFSDYYVTISGTECSLLQTWNKILKKVILIEKTIGRIRKDVFVGPAKLNEIRGLIVSALQPIDVAKNLVYKMSKASHKAKKVSKGSLAGMSTKVATKPSEKFTNALLHPNGIENFEKTDKTLENLRRLRVPKDGKPPKGPFKRWLTVKERKTQSKANWDRRLRDNDKMGLFNKLEHNILKINKLIMKFGVIERKLTPWLGPMMIQFGIMRFRIEIITDIMNLGNNAADEFVTRMASVFGLDRLQPDFSRNINNIIGGMFEKTLNTIHVILMLLQHITNLFQSIKDSIVTTLQTITSEFVTLWNGSGLVDSLQTIINMLDSTFGLNALICGALGAIPDDVIPDVCVNQSNFTEKYKEAFWDDLMEAVGLGGNTAGGAAISQSTGDMNRQIEREQRRNPNVEIRTPEQQFWDAQPNGEICLNDISDRAATHIYNKLDGLFLGINEKINEYERQINEKINKFVDVFAPILNIVPQIDKITDIIDDINNLYNSDLDSINKFFKIFRYLAVGKVCWDIPDVCFSNCTPNKLGSEDDPVTYNNETDYNNAKNQYKNHLFVSIERPFPSNSGALDCDNNRDHDNDSGTGDAFRGYWVEQYPEDMVNDVSEVNTDINNENNNENNNECICNDPNGIGVIGPECPQNNILKCQCKFGYNMLNLKDNNGWADNKHCSQFWRRGNYMRFYRDKTKSQCKRICDDDWDCYKATHDNTDNRCWTMSKSKSDECVLQDYYRFDTYYKGVSEICLENKCSCDNGRGAKGIDCPIDGDNVCKYCNQGFHLENNECVENKCTCDNGNPVTGRYCYKDGMKKCDPGGCNSGYTFVGGRCEKSTNGWLDNKYCWGFWDRRYADWRYAPNERACEQACKSYGTKCKYAVFNKYQRNPRYRCAIMNKNPRNPRVGGYCAFRNHNSFKTWKKPVRREEEHYEDESLEDYEDESLEHYEDESLEHFNQGAIISDTNWEVAVK